MRFTLLLLAVFLSLPALANSWLHELHHDFINAAKNHRIPGFAWVYVDENNKEHIFLYGKTERNGTAINDETLFRLASVSKTFTAALMAKMVESKQLDWHTPITNLAPGQGFDRRHPLALAHIVGQSSGYMPNAYDNLIEANYHPDRVLRKLAQLEPICAPGRCYTYQNALLSSVDHFLQRQGLSYANLLNTQLLDPLGMTRTHVGKDKLTQATNWAKPHIAVSRKRFKKTKVKNSYYNFAPAAGVNSSVQDMTLWLKAMLGQYPQTLSPPMIKDLTTPRIRTKKELRRRHWRHLLTDAHYGLGWRIYDMDGETLNYHGGWVQGYRADIAFAPKQRVGYSMLINAETNLINQFTANFWQRYFNLWRNAQQQAIQAE